MRQFVLTTRQGVDKMADKQEEIFLTKTLKNDEIPIAIKLAEALRADEVEKFLELYDNIPKTLEIQRVDKIKEMARQLAALPKKQFEMYRTKPKTLVSRESFTLPSSLNTTEKLAIPHIETKSKDFELKEIFFDMSANAAELTEPTEVPKTKSAKKKSKKKKKKAANLENTCVNSTDSTSNDSSSIMENKLLDPNESLSRIATMNKTMVADISVTSPVKTTKTVQTGLDVTDSTKINGEKESLENEHTKQTDSEQYATPEEIIGISPPFGYPLSTDKLIQSAIDLLSCEPASNNIYAINNNRTSDQQSNELLKDTNDTSMNSSVEIDSNLDCDSGDSISRSPDPMDAKLKVDESVDGDISNLSAFDEDEGWQSQGRRSHRRKKKELQSKERSSFKNNKDFMKEPKQSNSYKRQNPRNAHNKNKTDSVHESKIVSPHSAEIDNVEKVDKSDVAITDPLNVLSLKDKEASESTSSAAMFSYRDALLKVKPKTEELQYNSDSGVDVNSVGSCDSVIHSPKMINEFDLDEAVTYFMKGWEEVRERHKQGKVVYHREGDSNGFPPNRKKNFRRQWHSKTKHQVK